MRRARVLLALAGAMTASATHASCGDVLPPLKVAGPLRDVAAADLVRLRAVGELEPAIYGGPSPLAPSPDGRRLAFVVRQANAVTNRTCVAVVVFDLATRRSVVIDTGDEPILDLEDLRGSLVHSGYPATIVPGWTSDGRWVLYRKQRAGKIQLWRARADGGGATPLTRFPVDVERWGFDATGRRLLVEARPGMVAAEHAVDREMLGGVLYDGRVDPGDGVRPLPSSRLPKVVTSLDLDGGDARSATAAERSWFGEAPVTGVPIAPLAERDGWRATAPAESASPLAVRRILVVDPRGRSIRCAAASCADGIVQIWWTGSRTLVFLRREGWRQGHMAFYRWRPGDRSPVRLAESPYWLTGCRQDGGRLFCIGENATTPQRLVAIDLTSGRDTTLLDLNPEFAQLRLGSVRRVEWRNARGLPAWGDLVLPPDWRPGRKLPLVVVQYRSLGFLRGGTGDEYPIFPLAARGMAVLSVERPAHVAASMPDIRSADDINAAGLRDWGERRSLFSSIETGIDRVVALGMIDPARIGISGLSDGSTTLQWALVNSRRIAAAVTSTCCTDPATIMTYGGTDWADWNHAVLGYPLASEPDPTFWRPQSLALNAARVRTPLLMQLADREFLLGLEAFTALREQRRPVELQVFPDEYHYKAQPAHRLAIYERNLDWFAYWLLGTRDPDPAKADQYARWDKLRALRDASPPPASSAALRPEP